LTVSVLGGGRQNHILEDTDIRIPNTHERRIQFPDKYLSKSDPV